MTEIIQNHLAKYGYEIIALPKPDWAPLQLLIREGNALTYYGDNLLPLFEPDLAGLPPIRQTQAANLEAERQLSTDASAGFNLLSGLFKALGLQDSQLKGSLSHIDGLQFSFSYKGIQEEKVELMALDNFVAGAIPQKSGFERSIERLKQGELYVITALLKSANFEVSLSSSATQQAKLEAAVKEIADLNAALKRLGSYSFSLHTHEELPPLAFAFKAARIIYDKPRWFELWNKKEAGFRIKNQQGMVMRDLEDFPIDPLRSEEGVVDI